MWAFKLSLIIVIGGLVISPWYYRNYAGFDRMFLTSNSGAYLKAQFLQLKNKGSGLDIMSADIKHKKALSNYLVSNNKSNFCLDNERHVSCDKIVANSTIIMILDEPLQSHAPALLNSWATLFFSGGASNIRNYLGLDGKSNIINFQNKSFNGFNSIYDLIRNMPFSYFLIFSFTTLFSIITRVVGFFGLYYLFVNKKFRPYGVILTEILFIFTSAYLYLGQSRFRVPLDPILMLFTVIGILYIVKTVELNKRKDVEIK